MSINNNYTTQQNALYKTLLTKYINHVVQCEGSSFVGDDYWQSNVVFTEQELRILKRIENRLYPD